MYLVTTVTNQPTPFRQQLHTDTNHMYPIVVPNDISRRTYILTTIIRRRVLIQINYSWQHWIFCNFMWWWLSISIELITVETLQVQKSFDYPLYIITRGVSSHLTYTSMEQTTNKNHIFRVEDRTNCNPKIHSVSFYCYRKQRFRRKDCWRHDWTIGWCQGWWFRQIEVGAFLKS